MYRYTGRYIRMYRYTGRYLLYTLTLAELNSAIFMYQQPSMEVLSCKKLDQTGNTSVVMSQTAKTLKTRSTKVKALTVHMYRSLW